VLDESNSNTLLDHESAKSQALLRDDNKCVLTGSVDKAWALGNEQVVDLGTGLVTTNCTRIFAYSSEISAIALNVFQRYGGVGIERLAEGDGHRLSNVLTLSLEAHHDFNKLMVWLEPTDIENCYSVGVLFEQLHQQYLKSVSFPQVKNLPVPDPKLLALHAACSRVCKMSGF